MPDNPQSESRPVIGDLTGVGELANSELVRKGYDHLFAGAAQQAGMALTDFVKAFRLILTPIHLMGIGWDRVERLLHDAEARVPPERQQEASPEIALPLLREFACVADDSPLRAMFLELLTRAIDRTRSQEVHPAFPKIIGQLESDEAKLLAYLQLSGGRGFYKSDNFIPGLLPTENSVQRPALLGSSTSPRFVGELAERGILFQTPETPYLPAMLDHFESLGLLCWVDESDGQSTSRNRQSRLTWFGLRFVDACIPERFGPPVTGGE